MSGLGSMNNQKVVKSDAHVDQGASATQLDPSISESERECKEDNFIIQGSKVKEEYETKGNDYEQRISQLTKSLSKREEEVIKLKIDLNANKMLLKEKLKEKYKAYNEQEAIKLQLERELAVAKEEMKLLNERLNSSKEEELKQKISELEKEMNEKVQHLQLKEEQLSEKEKSVFNAEGSDTADKRDRELHVMIKQVEDLKEESKKNIAEATQRIDKLEEIHKEQLEEIDKLREENTILAGTVEEQGNMRERLTELEALFDKVAASHEEEMNDIRRKEETKRVELEEKWKRKFDEESQQRLQFHLQEMKEAMEEVKKKYKDRLQAREKELQVQLEKFNQENKELKEHLYNREEAYTVLQDSLDKKSVTSMALEKQVEDIVNHSAEKDQKIKEISEILAWKEAQNELLKQDFESERKDRERINDQLIQLQKQHEILKQESTEKEAQMKFHKLNKSKSILVRDLEESRKDIATKGAEIESLIQKIAQLEKQHTEEMKKIKKKLIDSEAGETERMKEMKEEMQILTAQVNAYSREVDKQKGLVTQSQEKHKTEVLCIIFMCFTWVSVY
ncbi:PREDICTED: trichohyalin-like [Amphimedon queenslandica]|uniref:Uncharacterized protein n=1 Tax=Amphimedon queenslandica TaxID=400682 RepID=A0AAN0JK66_AMPQE|nr:PREDICTED: trichohyalin-like [Amphimedon queenslandica]|eukprot:XP_019857162.1 PREDICTED: trichohyalin-like [Amphimedon queenslandica]